MSATPIPKIEAAGESALRITFAESPSPDLTAKLLAIADATDAALPHRALSAVPGFQTLTLHFDPQRVSRDAVHYALEAALVTAVDSPSTGTFGKLVTLPVYYDAEVAPDLLWMAEHADISAAEVASRHSAAVYHAMANGFAPGFCYLAEVETALAAPRLSTPRRRIAAGSVGIADRQTGVYPAPSPGGWRIIGRCPTPLFDIGNNPPHLISVGDRVQFEAIDRDRFIAEGGVI